jgi:hypothetical protein
VDGPNTPALTPRKGGRLAEGIGCDDHQHDGMGAGAGGDHRLHVGRGGSV